MDPNAEIVESLSESEGDAYYEVLYGVDPFGESDGSGEIEAIGDLWGGGCNGEAYGEVFGAMNQVFTELGPQLEELNQRVEADPRFREAEEAWAGCMAERGFPYDSQETMFEQVNEEFSRRLEEIVGAENVAFDPFAGMSRRRGPGVRGGALRGRDCRLFRPSPTGGDGEYRSGCAGGSPAGGT